MSDGFKTITSAGPTAPWLTLVHAMTQDHRAFSAQLDAFSTTHQLMLIDLPGHGLAKDVPGPYGHVEFMEHVRSVLLQTDIGPTHFWATHTGTAVGLLLAKEQPALLRSLILEGAVISGFPMPYVMDTLSKAGTVAKEKGIRTAVDSIFFQARWYDIIRAHPVECRADEHLEILRDFEGAPWIDTGTPKPARVSDEDLRKITLPTLVYNGEFDLDDFVQVADHLEKNLPNCQRVRIAKAGGFPAWEYPGETNAVVSAFLGQQ